MRILIADDHAVVRRGLRETIADAFPETVFAEAASAREVTDKVRDESWDVVLLDLEMPGPSGLDALRDLRRLKPSLPVLVVSMHEEAEYGVRALRGGAAGYLPKHSAAEQVATAIDRVVHGGKFVSESLAERLASDLAAPRELAHQRLSDRELEVLRRLANGQTVKEIAFDLGLSAKTVHTFRARVLKKLQLRTTADLVRYALQHGLHTA